VLQVEPGLPDPVLKGLESRGHVIEPIGELQPGWGPVSIIELDGTERRAAADPRLETATALVF
jgi:gamma-glutamyltranspeptidase